jgi:hypothetical protein
MCNGPECKHNFKTCNVCDETKPSHAFAHDRNTCRVCVNKAKRAEKQKTKKANRNNPRFCDGCKTMRTEGDWYDNGARNCKFCIQAERKKSTDEIKVAEKQQKLRKCKSCGQTKPLTDFKAIGASRHSTQCLQCLEDASEKKKITPDKSEEAAEFEYLKICSNRFCEHKILPVSQFYKLRGKPMSECKFCANARRLKLRSTPKEDEANERKCTICKLIKPNSEFNRHGARYYKGPCKVCQSEAGVVYFNRKKAYAHAIKMDMSRGFCMNDDCKKGTNFLHFAHLDRETKLVKNGKRARFLSLTFEQMDAEKTKGRWLCARCHAVETEAENEEFKSDQPCIQIQQRAKKLARSNQHKLARGKCAECGVKVEAPFSYFHWDHRNPEEKEDAVCSMIHRCLSSTRIDAEEDKCDVTCADCHFVRTQVQKAEYKERKKQKRIEKQLLAAANQASVE